MFNFYVANHVLTPTTCENILQEVDALPDPCPLPATAKQQQQQAAGGGEGGSGSGGAAAAPARRRSLRDHERRLHAPMSDVGGLLYDKDAVYVDIPDWRVSEG
jgi:ribosome biogenesis protein BMS1